MASVRDLYHINPDLSRSLCYNQTATPPVPRWSCGIGTLRIYFSNCDFLGQGSVIREIPPLVPARRDGFPARLPAIPCPLAPPRPATGGFQRFRPPIPEPPAKFSLRSGNFREFAASLAFATM